MPYDLQPLMNAVRPGQEAGLGADEHGRLPDLLRRWMDLSELERRAFSALCEEVSATSDLVEVSTVDLSERFKALAVDAQRQSELLEAVVAAAGKVDVGGKSLSFGEITMFIEGVLGKVIDTIQVLQQQAARIVGALEGATRQVDETVTSIRAIEEINRQANFLAINAAIEANRAGDAGRTFLVVASEVRALSRSTHALAEKMRGQISTVASSVKNGHAILKEVVETNLDISEHMQSKDALECMLQGLADQNQKFSSVLAQVALNSADQSHNVTRLITGIQFQDRAKQHLDHVVDTLSVLGSALASLQQDTRPEMSTKAWDGQFDKQWLQEILDKFSLSDMRKRFVARVLGDGAVAVTQRNHAADDGSVEIF